jgi:LDH2 family malate/lactate/ureidoglycolate dehydrogenase
MAWDAEGEPTTDPVAALAGAFAVWGGHRGSGLALAIQLFGILCGGGALPADYEDCGFMAIVFRPDLFMDAKEFGKRASEYAAAVRASRRIDPDKPIRVPFDRSAEFRRNALAEGSISVDARVVEALSKLTSPL